MKKTVTTINNLGMIVNNERFDNTNTSILTDTSLLFVEDDANKVYNTFSKSGLSVMNGDIYCKNNVICKEINLLIRGTLTFTIKHGSGNNNINNKSIYAVLYKYDDITYYLLYSRTFTITLLNGNNRVSIGNMYFKDINNKQYIFKIIIGSMYFNHISSSQSYVREFSCSSSNTGDFSYYSTFDTWNNNDYWCHLFDCSMTIYQQ